MRLGVIALLLQLGEKQHRVGVAHHALGDAGHGLVELVRLERLARAQRAQRIAHRRRSRGVRGARRGVFLLHRGELGVLLLAGAREVDGASHRAEAPLLGQPVEDLLAVRIDEHRFAKFLQSLELLGRLQHEALELEGRLGPRAVEPGDVHPELQLRDGHRFSHRYSSLGFKITPCSKARDRN
jgi:hypothetical protein